MFSAVQISHGRLVVERELFLRLLSNPRPCLHGILKTARHFRGITFGDASVPVDDMVIVRGRAVRHSRRLTQSNDLRHVAVAQCHVGGPNGSVEFVVKDRFSFSTLSKSATHRDL